MPGMGPAPKPAASRRRTNATPGTTKLPAEGRQGDPPAWPLLADVRAAAQLSVINEQIDDLALQAQGTDRAARSAQRRMLALRERAEVLMAEVEVLADQEKSLWAELWATPQAVAWERLRWTREVAQYARWKVRAEMGDLDAAKESRQLADRLGLNPLALLRLRWEIAADEVAGQRADRATRSTSSAARKSRFKAIDGGAG